MADKCVLDYLKILNVRPQYAMQFLFMLLSLSICGLVGHPNTFYSNRPNPHRSPADDLWICSSPFCCAFSAFYWNCVSPSLKVYNYCLRDHTFSLVAAMHSFLLFFFFAACCSTSDIQRGAFCVWLCPKAVVLQCRLIITEYTTSGKTIWRSLMSNMRETKITKKKKLTRKGLERWSFFLPPARCSISCYCCFLLFHSANIKEDLKERRPWQLKMRSCYI